MTATIPQPENLQLEALQTYPDKVTTSLPSRFFQWAADEDKEHHIAWVCVSITIMAAVFFPATMFVVLLNGMVFLPMLMAIVSLATVMVANLAAMSTRYTIPVLIIAILVDVIAMIVSFYIK